MTTSALQGIRTLTAIHNQRPTERCEFGDEDECSEQAAFFLTAEASYVMPMLMCAAHAEEENFYFGTRIPS